MNTHEILGLVSARYRPVLESFIGKKKQRTAMFSIGNLTGSSLLPHQTDRYKFEGTACVTLTYLAASINLPSLELIHFSNSTLNKPAVQVDEKVL